MTKELSIIVPVYNENNLLEKFIKKLFETFDQTTTKFIFIDDGSNDGSKEFLIENISNYINDSKLQKFKKNQRILYPGQKEYEEEKLRTKYGIPFDIELQNEFLKIDKNYNLNYFNNLI